MAIMKCPKCGGSGEIIKYEQQGFTTAAGNTQVTCPSCGGKGYVSDTVIPLAEALEETDG